MNFRLVHAKMPLPHCVPRVELTSREVVYGPPTKTISHALAGGRTLAEVKAAAGHESLLTTSVNLHVVVDEREEIGDLFAARTI